jgi:lipoprotein NlpI
MKRAFRAGLPALVLAAGCVQVQLAQDKPLDINLNVNIKQEVVVTLKGEAQDLIKNNPGVF